MADDQQPAGAATTPDIPRLVKLLDSDNFQLRQQATDQLVEFGNAAIRPLAKSYLNSTPEKRWRIKRILESVAIQGDETTFFKSIAILRLMFFDETVLRVDELSQQWKSNRTLIAANRLRSLGAAVELYQTQAIQDDFGGAIFGGGRIIVGGGAMVLDTVPEPESVQRASKSTATEPSAKRQETLNPTQFIDEVDRILLGSIEQNRQLALGSQSAKRQVSEREQLAAGFAGPEFFIDDGVLIARDLRQHMVINAQGISENRYLGSGVRFGPEWQGAPSDLALLSSIQNLTNIAFQSQNLDASHIESLLWIPEIRTLSFDDCTLTERAMELLTRLETVKQLTLRNVTLSQPLAQSILGMKKLTYLSLDQVQFDADTLEIIAAHKMIQGMSLHSTLLKPDFFEQIGNLLNLRQLQLQGCKFDIAAYREFARTHSQVEVNVVGRAFLGVRAPVSTLPNQFILGAGGCEISDVVSDSGAARAGLEPRDNILAIAGMPIESFQELILLVSQYEPGEVIEVEFERNRERRTVEIRLGDRSTVSQ